MTSKAIILGGSGMLGSMVADYLSRDKNIKVAATVRTKEMAAKCRERINDIEWAPFDASAPDIDKALDIINGYEWIINAIGITKPLVHDNNLFEVERAIKINSILPFHIARKAEANKAKVIQIATDCVYSGRKGHYVETDEFDPLDVYGKTKNLGEMASPSNYLLRCSIIGPEPKEHKFLLDWFLGQPQKAKVNGYTNHDWNGVTTLQFARLCHGIINKGTNISTVQHIIPTEEITKYDMLKEFAKCYHRDDIVITPTQAPVVVDRTLKTKNEASNLAIWAAAGYAKPPSVPDMIAELSRYKFRLTGI
jgi:dTDP-4-dehydrorhamnose reductase